MATIELNERDFVETVKKPGIVFVDFWAPWCGPCRVFAPIYEKFAAAHPDATFGKVNTQDEPALASAFGIRAIPTLMVLKDGVPIFSQAGMLPPAALASLLDQARSLDMAEVRKALASQPTVPDEA